MRRARLVVFGALILALPACAHLLRQYDIAPNGMPRADARFRDWLSGGRADSALARLTRGESGPGDALLRALYTGAAAYYAGDYATSGEQLERALALSEERVTKSVSRSALSLISNDLVLPYEPSRTERLFLPYFAALGRLRTGDTAGAAVEARRLSALLERFESDGWTAEPGLRATLRYVAGAIFEAAGERNDAIVAYRNAAALNEDLVSPADTAWPRPITEANGAGWTAAPGPAPAGGDSAMGDVIVVVERGYVAHRAAEALWVLLAPHELHAFGDGRDEHRRGIADALAGRVLRGEPPPPPPPPADECESDCDTEEKATEKDGERKHSYRDDDPFLLKVAWPVMRRSPAHASIGLFLGDAPVALHDLADVSSAAIADFESERLLILARTLGRAALKTALAHAAETEAGEKDDDAGRIVGLLANAGSVLLEQADTRSWHLLPGRLSIARVRVPAGRHALAVTVDGRRITLNPIDVPARGVAIATTRIW